MIGQWHLFSDDYLECDQEVITVWGALRCPLSSDATTGEGYIWSRVDSLICDLAPTCRPTAVEHCSAHSSAEHNDVSATGVRRDVRVPRGVTAVCVRTDHTQFPIRVSELSGGWSSFLPPTGEASGGKMRELPAYLDADGELIKHLGPALVDQCGW